MTHIYIYIYIYTIRDLYILFLSALLLIRFNIKFGNSVRDMVFNDTLYNISVILWLSVLLMEGLI